MANVNSFGGVYNLPKATQTDTLEHALTVPTLASPPSGITWSAPYYETALPSAGNIYAGYPSPLLPVNSGLTISFPPDVNGTLAVDGHPFKVKLAVVFNNTGAGNLTVKLYQVPLANLGTISATGSVTTAGAPGSGDQNIYSVAFTTPSTGHFWLEAILNWDSSTAKLDGYTIGAVNNTAVAQTAVTNQLTSGVAAVSALNFLPSLTFATGNASNAITVQEFSLERY